MGYSLIPGATAAIVQNCQKEIVTFVVWDNIYNLLLYILSVFDSTRPLSLQQVEQETPGRWNKGFRVQQQLEK